MTKGSFDPMSRAARSVSNRLRIVRPTYGWPTRHGAASIRSPVASLRFVRDSAGRGDTCPPAHLGPGPEAGLRKLLIREHADQDDRTHHGEIQRARNAKQVDEVLQHLQQNRAEDDAQNGAFAAAQRAAAEHGRRDGIELVEIACEAGEIERVYMAM
jgi:hypothetical protein